jgi:hypothetical protein
MKSRVPYEVSSHSSFQQLQPLGLSTLPLNHSSRFFIFDLAPRKFCILVAPLFAQIACICIYLFHPHRIEFKKIIAESTLIKVT